MINYAKVNFYNLVVAMAEILVIDDHNGDRYIIVEALIGLGHRVLQAKNGAEGLALYQKNLPALVVTDIVMPEKDGIETIRELRRIAPHLPILAVSGTEHSDFYLSAVTLFGADGVLAKPFSFDGLIRAVANLLSHSQEEEGGSVAGAASPRRIRARVRFTGSTTKK